MEQTPTEIQNPNSSSGTKAEFKKTRHDEARRRKNMKGAAVALIIVCLVGGAIYGAIAYRRSRTKNLPGVAFEEQGREHVGPGHPHAYNSNPPTSGPHFTSPIDWGVYKDELLDEALIHNLEHGGVWISYRPDISEELKKKLEGFYAEFGRKIIVTPRAKNDADVALAAWTRLDTFSAREFSEERVRRFIKAFRNKGPEFVP